MSSPPYTKNLNFGHPGIHPVTRAFLAVLSIAIAFGTAFGSTWYSLREQKKLVVMREASEKTAYLKMLKAELNYNTGLFRSCSADAAFTAKRDTRGITTHRAAETFKPLIECYSYGITSGKLLLENEEENNQVFRLFTEYNNFLFRIKIMDNIAAQFPHSANGTYIDQYNQKASELKALAIELAAKNAELIALIDRMIQTTGQN
jgi:hypothetical protein